MMMRRLLLASVVACATGVGVAATDGPGDYRGNYDDPNYETRSRPLGERVGQPADLVGRAQTPQLGLPAIPVPADNPITVESVELGRKLFYDRRMSLNGTQSCAICHIPEQGFTNNELAIAVGTEGRSVGRNTPTLYNVAYKDRLFHDARETSLENQAWQPILHPNEMATPSIGVALERLRNLPDYKGLFEAAFDGQGPDLDTVAKALASYQRTLVSANSPFDRWHFGGDEQAVAESVKRGFELFKGKAGCVACHLVGENDAVFTDHKTHNTGIGFARSTRNAAPKTARVLIAPGVYYSYGPEVFDELGGDEVNDLGRYQVTSNPDDRWSFKTPTLRNVALTAPYMHNGVFMTLPDVVAFYNRGGEANELLSPLIRPLGLDAGEQADLVQFLESLTGEYDTLVKDGFAAPIGDPDSADRTNLHFGKDYVSGAK
jgi:cytochrome c peroxidase